MGEEIFLPVRLTGHWRGCLLMHPHLVSQLRTYFFNHCLQLKAKVDGVKGSHAPLAGAGQSPAGGQGATPPES